MSICGRPGPVNAQKNGKPIRFQVTKATIDTRRRRRRSPLGTGAKRRCRTIGSGGRNAARFDANADVEAAWRGYRRIATKLLQAGAQLDKADKSGNAPLAWAAINGHTNLIIMLIKAGAAVDVVDSQSFTPLKRAAWNGHRALVNALLAAGAEPWQANRIGQTAIDYARLSGNPRVLRQLRAT